HHFNPGPDFSTVLRNIFAPSLRISATHSICHRIAATCGHRSGCLAAWATIASGEDKGKTAAAKLAGEPGEATAVAAKPNTNTCPKVTGIDSVCTSRTVDAWAPMVRNTAPNSR